MLHMNMALEIDSTSLRINGNPKHGLAVDQLTPNREGLCSIPTWAAELCH